jgi:hypothetical protein
MNVLLILTFKSFNECVTKSQFILLILPQVSVWYLAVAGLVHVRARFELWFIGGHLDLLSFCFSRFLDLFLVNIAYKDITDEDCSLMLSFFFFGSCREKYVK